MMDFQTTGEAFIPQGRTSSALKHYISSLFSFLSVIFAYLDLDPHSRCANVDPDQANKTNADPDPQYWYKDKETKQMLDEGRIVMIYLHTMQCTANICFADHADSSLIPLPIAVK
jgi:hypothetical protein